MSAISAKLLTTPGVKGAAFSTGVHLFAIASLLYLRPSAHNESLIVLASNARSSITLELSPFEISDPEQVSEIRVEVEPFEARIAEHRFIQEPTFNFSIVDLSDTKQELTESLTVRNRKQNSLPTIVESELPPIPRRAANRHHPNVVGSLVASVASTETTLPDFGSNQPPTYPRVAISRRWEGTVLLSIQISRDGSVTSVTIIESSGFEVLDGAAINAVRNWKAIPAKRAGTPFDTTVRLPVMFRLPTR